MITAKVDITQFMRRLQAITRNSTDVSGALLKIQGDTEDRNPMTVIGGINAAFITKGASIGSPWKSLSMSYAKWKSKKFPGKPMLVRTGLMYNSVTRPGASGNVRDIFPRKLVWGTTVPYAVYHQSDAPRTVIPYRPFMKVTKPQADVWAQMIADWILGIQGAK